MTSQRSTTLAVLGLLAGFVNVDAFRMAPAAPRVVSSSFARAQTSAVLHEASTRTRTWQTTRGLKMSSASALGSDLSATEELDDKPSRASVMDELDAILGDAQVLRRSHGDRVFCSGLALCFCFVCCTCSLVLVGTCQVLVCQLLYRTALRPFGGCHAALPSVVPC